MAFEAVHNTVFRVLAIGLQPAIIGVSETATCWNIMCKLYRLFLKLLFVLRREHSVIFISYGEILLYVRRASYTVFFFFVPVVDIHNAVRTGTISVTVRVFCCVDSTSIVPPSRYFCIVLPSVGDRGSTVVKVLCCKSEGRWFDPSWCQWVFH